MRTTTKIAVLGGILLAPVLAMLPTSPASAHGYISNPPSRQAQCAAGTVECGDIKYEPQSVEGPKGLTSCSGGNSRFAELDDDAKNWQATPVGRNQTFTWSLSARHSTSTWQYFIGGTKIAEFDDGGAQPPATVEHQVDFGSFTGRQKVLAVWNVADTTNAFYACIDVNIGGTATDPETPAPVAGEFPVSEEQFNQLFPNRNPFYTYAGLVEALSAYPEFTNAGDEAVQKREAAAFIANVAHETGDLLYVVEQNEANYPHYCDPNQSYGCPAGNDQYYGRGPVQLSWNFNYKAAGDALGIDLLNNPNLVATDPAVAWKTGLWYWNTQNGPGTMTPHAAMVNGAGFGETIRSINGSIECNGGNPAQVQSRVDNYTEVTSLLGVDPGGNLYC